MPTPDVERALAAGAERSRAAVARETRSPAAAAARGIAGRVDRLAAWFGALPPERRKLIIGIGLFLLFDLIAGLAAVTMGTHF